MTVNSVAILGGGIMGCSAALQLARRGIRSVIFEEAEDIFSGASRWNEGKVHLGYLYSADPSLLTAREVLPGGLQFRRLVEELIETSIAEVITQGDDLYLCHAHSVVRPDAMTDYFRKVDQLVHDHAEPGDYLVDLRSAASAALDADRLRHINPGTEIVAGFSVPERSVDTGWIADRFVETVKANGRISRCTGTRVLGVAELAGGERWEVLTSTGREGPFDCVINALWQGKLAVDDTVRLPLPREWSHRYRVSMFVRTRTPLTIPSAVIAAGPFGDIKNYNGRDFYLSWYPAGLLAEGSDLSLPAVPQLDAARTAELSRSIIGNLARFIPAVREIERHMERQAIAGGWVYAAATGSLSDPQATLHHRDGFGITRRGRYLSVDTGKYSTAPWLAKRLVSEILGEAEPAST